MPKYERLASKNADNPHLPKIALVEVPPYGPPLLTDHGGEPWSVTGRLSSRREWFVQAPLEITLEQGLVKNVSTDPPSLAAVNGPASVGVLANMSAHTNQVP